MAKPTQGKQGKLMDIPIGVSKPNPLTNLTPSQPKLSSNEQEVLDYLKGKDFVSPTQIGQTLHPTRINYGSPWASPICLRLANKGLLQRSDKGWYRNPAR